jgi:hypothetical protein
MQQMKLISRILILGVVLTLVMPGAVMGQNSKPNILVIMGDDIGIPNISKFNVEDAINDLADPISN